MAQAICLSPSSLAIHVGWPSYRTSQLCAAEAYTGETCLVDDGDGGVGLAKVDTKNGRLGPVDAVSGCYSGLYAYILKREVGM